VAAAVMTGTGAVALTRVVAMAGVTAKAVVVAEAVAGSNSHIRNINILFLRLRIYKDKIKNS
jgi:hypothetical protein